MDHFTSQLREAFARFKRPACVVVHPGVDACYDCPDVADTLANTDCESILSSDNLLLGTIPLDCMNADAILHYLPAMVNQAIQPDGIRIAETLAWILGATEWDSDLTISDQIKPQLNAEQLELIRAILAKLGELPLSSHAAGDLTSAIRMWHSPE